MRNKKIIIGLAIIVILIIGYFLNFKYRQNLFVNKGFVTLTDSPLDTEYDLTYDDSTAYIGYINFLGYTLQINLPYDETKPENEQFGLIIHSSGAEELVFFSQGALFCDFDSETKKIVSEDDYTCLEKQSIVDENITEIDELIQLKEDFYNDELEENELIGVSE